MLNYYFSEYKCKLALEIHDISGDIDRLKDLSQLLHPTYIV